MDRAKPLLLADGRLYRFFPVAPALPPPPSPSRHPRICPWPPLPQGGPSVLYALTNTSWRWQLRDDAGRPAVLINF